ncbi:hypothetical protein OK074_1714 [Actinobacteria bacterium OK074]|nr:hypothetical protein OK074_1714 [Actinobacteria bacterium OK074]
MSEELTAARAAVPAGSRPKVAFLHLRGSAAVYLIGGRGSGADSPIEAAGAVDAGKEAGLDRPFTPLTSEALVTAAPDVIPLGYGPRTPLVIDILVDRIHAARARPGAVTQPFTNANPTITPSNLLDSSNPNMVA